MSGIIAAFVQLKAGRERVLGVLNNLEPCKLHSPNPTKIITGRRERRNLSRDKNIIDKIQFKTYRVTFNHSCILSVGKKNVVSKNGYSSSDMKALSLPSNREARSPMRPSSPSSRI